MQAPVDTPEKESPLAAKSDKREQIVRALEAVFFFIVGLAAIFRKEFVLKSRGSVIATFTGGAVWLFAVSMFCAAGFVICKIIVSQFPNSGGLSALMLRGIFLYVGLTAFGAALFTFIYRGFVG